MSLASANLGRWILRTSQRRAVLMIKIVILLLVAVSSHMCAGPPGLAQQPPVPRTFQIENKINAAENPLTKDTGGITREQADAILAELREIRRLLGQQQVQMQRALPLAGLPISKIQMTVRSGWQAIGRDDAPVTIVEFTDLQCPVCRRFHAETFPIIKKNYIDTGKVRFVSRDMPLEYHQYALKAAEATRCAGDQGKFWELRGAIL